MLKNINRNLPVEMEIAEIDEILIKYYKDSLERVDFDLPWDEFGEMIERQRKSEIESVQEELKEQRKRSTRKAK
jgi:hypothetical protein